MTDKPPTPRAPTKNNTSKLNGAASKATYISGGQMLDSPPLTVRLSRFADSTYNFLGLYVTSLFALDGYAAAQNSSFNTVGPGRVSNQARAGWGATGPGSAGAGGPGSGNGGPRGGGGGGSGGRRLGTIHDLGGDGPTVEGPAGCYGCG